MKRIIKLLKLVADKTNDNYVKIKIYSDGSWSVQDSGDEELFGTTENANNDLEKTIIDFILDEGRPVTNDTNNGIDQE